MSHFSSQIAPDKLLELLAYSKEATVVFTSAQMHIGFINQAMLDIWKKSTEVVGMRLTDAAPEFASFLPILEEVWRTGNSYIAEETAAAIDVSGILTTYYFDFEYRAVLDESGRTAAIINTATNVTDRMMARTIAESRRENEEHVRKQLEFANSRQEEQIEELDQLNMALQLSRAKVEKAAAQFLMIVEAANFGTWHINLASGHSTIDSRLKELFGFEPDEPTTLDSCLQQISIEFREYVASSIDTCIRQGGSYDLTYTVVSKNKAGVRWLRAVGHASIDAPDFPFFAGVVMDITQQKLDEQRKSDFIGIVSHELKTPLTSLNGYVQILHARALKQDDAYASGVLGKSVVQLKKMSAMINGFLNVSKLESAKFQLLKSRFDLGELVEEVIEDLELVSASHPFVFERNCRSVIFADRDKIGHVVNNLLTNAMKYSGKGTPIYINCSCDEHMAQVSVQDNGVGIKEVDKSHLFDRYFRVEADHMAGISGFGIGLYLSAEIVRMHEGEIWVESTYGAGATFYFSLPTS